MSRSLSPAYRLSILFFFPSSFPTFLSLQALRIRQEEGKPLFFFFLPLSLLICPFTYYRQTLNSLAAPLGRTEAKKKKSGVIQLRLWLPSNPFLKCLLRSRGLFVASAPDYTVGKIKRERASGRRKRGGQKKEQRIISYV